jgi:hypothetical protein
MSHIETVARRKVGGAPEWECFRLERIGAERDTLVEGGIPRTITRGNRRGQKTWKGGSAQKAVVTGAEIDAEHARYELDTGMCGDCFGRGYVCYGWSIEHGSKSKPCPRCFGRGKSKDRED